MKKYVIVAIIGIALICFSGYSVYSRMNSYHTAFNALEEQKQQLEQELINTQQEVENLNQVITLRNLLDQQFYQVLRLLEAKDTEGISELTTANITVKGNIILNKNPQNKGPQIEFRIPRGNYFFRQRSFGVGEKDKTKFSSCYEFYPDKRYANFEKTYELYIYYYQVDGKWKINSMFIDGIDHKVHRY